MNNVLRQSRSLAAFAVLCVFTLISCQRQPEKQVFSARGVVKNVIADGKGVRIAHEDIPGFMQAMTMDFEVKDPALLSGMQPEDTITFTLEKTSESLYITAINRVASPQDKRASTEPVNSDSSDEGEGEPPVAEDEFSPHPAANFTLTDQDGQSFSLADAKGKVVLLDFIFTRCPGPCPLLSLKFSQLQKQLGDRLGKDVMLLSVTIDPRHDTPEVLRDYAKRYEANLNGWKFLVGSTRDTILTATAFGAEYKADMDGIVDHRLITCVIDQDGVVVKEFTGTNHTVEDLVAEVNRLLS
ncbi:MAG: SCO family protein [Candidatus Binatia bacterium]